MRFSVKVAPGVRLSASGRGLRAHVGPRTARAHVGGGRSGFSTGAGPVSFYTPLGGSPTSARRTPLSQQPGASTAKTTTGQVSAQLARPSKIEEGAAIAAVLQHLQHLHEHVFPAAEAPRVPPPSVEGQEQILAAHQREARRGLSVFSRKKRRLADEAARWAAFHEIEHRWAAAKTDHETRQQAADDWWGRLNACDPDTVWDQLGRAFADNEAAAAPLAVHDRHVDLAVLLPPVSALPPKMPGVTAAGNPSLRKMTKAQTALWYQVLAAGFILTTADEAFAVAPGLRSATLIALRPPDDPDLITAAECVVACTVHRDNLVGSPRRGPSPDVLTQVATELLVSPDGRSGAWKPLDLRDQPDLQAVIDKVDLDQLRPPPRGI